jgi:hypothetical protein
LSPGTSLSSSNKTSLHDITEILLKMSLSITTPFYLLVIMICRLLICSRHENIWKYYSLDVKSFIGGGKRSARRQVTDKLDHIMMHGVHLVWAGFELTLVVIGTQCIGSCKRYNWNIVENVIKHNHSLLFVCDNDLSFVNLFSSWKNSTTIRSRPRRPLYTWIHNL